MLATIFYISKVLRKWTYRFYLHPVSLLEFWYMLLLSLPAPITPFADFASSRQDLGHFHGQQRQSNLPPGCKGLKKYNITFIFIYIMIRFLSAPNISCDVLQQDTNTVCVSFCLEFFHSYCDWTETSWGIVFAMMQYKKIYLEETHLINSLSENRCSKKIIMYICNHCNTKYITFY